MGNKPLIRTMIAINPGWRYLAIAIFDGNELTEWRLKNLTDKTAKQKFKRVMEILKGFSEHYPLKVLAIKKLHPSRCSPNLKQMAARIIAYCRRKRMVVFAYTIQKMESILLNGCQSNRRELSRFLISKYPELSSEWQREESHRHPYFVRLFEAVALGHACLMRGNNH